MKKNAFTLAELLTVIVILGLITAIAYPVVLNILNSSKESTYDSQVVLVEKAAKEWGIDNVNELPEDCDAVIGISLDTLINEGYISGTEINGEEIIENPKKPGTALNGQVMVKCECKDGNPIKYSYKYTEKSE